MTDLNQIASLLESTMTNAGLMDDYDEIIDDVVKEMDKDAAKKYHDEVIAGLNFINEQLDKDYEIELWEDNYQMAI